jgi:hypothetical protein
MTKILQTIAAVLKLIILVPTAVPKTLAASLAPKDHPKNKPPNKNKMIVNSISIKKLNRTFN